MCELYGWLVTEAGKYIVLQIFLSEECPPPAEVIASVPRKLTSDTFVFVFDLHYVKHSFWKL